MDRNNEKDGHITASKCRSCQLKIFCAFWAPFLPVVISDWSPKKLLFLGLSYSQGSCLSYGFSATGRHSTALQKGFVMIKYVMKNDNEKTVTACVPGKSQLVFVRVPADRSRTDFACCSLPFGHLCPLLLRPVRPKPARVCLGQPSS